MSPEVLKAVLITAVCFGLLVVVPIIAIMTEHQRKMARLIRGEKEETSETAEILRALNGTPEKHVSSDELRALGERMTRLEQAVSQLAASQPDSGYRAEATESEADVRQTISGG